MTGRDTFGYPGEGELLLLLEVGEFGVLEPPNGLFSDSPQGKGGLTILDEELGFRNGYWLPVVALLAFSAA